MIRSRALLPSVIATVSAVLAAGPARAETDGLPQFDSSLFPSQLLWLALCFGFLYAMMSLVALPTVKRTQDKRAETIAAELATAQAANEAAKATMAQYEKALADARAQAQATVAEISSKAAKESAAQQAAQQQQLTKRLNEATAKIGAMRDTAVQDVKKTSGDLAGAIVARVTG